MNKISLIVSTLTVCVLILFQQIFDFLHKLHIFSIKNMIKNYGSTADRNIFFISTRIYEILIQQT